MNETIEIKTLILNGPKIGGAYNTTLIICGGGTLNGQITTRWMKTDTLGITSYFKEFPYWVGDTYHTTRTFDNKFVSVAMANDFWIYLYKLNSNLDYDSIYTRPFTYDSLCPGGVVSDTIDPDCDLIVRIDDPESESGSCKMKVFPNPASGRVTVEFPACLKQTTKQPGISSTSLTYQWRSTLLEAYDLNSRKVFSQEIPKSQQTLEIDVSGWRPGIYFFRLVFNDRNVSGGEVVVR